VGKRRKAEVRERLATRAKRMHCQEFPCIIRTNEPLQYRCCHGYICPQLLLQTNNCLLVSCTYSHSFSLLPRLGIWPTSTSIITPCSYLPYHVPYVVPCAAFTRSETDNIAVHQIHENMQLYLEFTVWLSFVRVHTSYL
jgi:hypothetical protein